MTVLLSTERAGTDYYIAILAISLASTSANGDVITIAWRIIFVKANIKIN
jgi:hypothetical protein